MIDPRELWQFVWWGYLITVVIEMPILVVGLSRGHSLGRRGFAGVWLTGCTYPIVVLVLPLIFADRMVYLAAAETFAPAAECVLFWGAFQRGQMRAGRWRDWGVIILANLASFGVGMLLI